MFGLFTSPDKQMRANARNWLDVADRVFNYRRDELSEAELADLQKKTETLRTQVREKAGAEKLKLSIEELEPVLRKTGGRIYPHSGLREWVEFFVVAAILLIGMRQFFVQPFKIPTNSMWPTYNGMFPEVHAKIEDEPGAAARLFRTLALGAIAYRVDAPVDGEIVIPVGYNSNEKTYYMVGEPVKGRHWLVLPQNQRRYYVVVGNQVVSVSVPEDFAMDWAIKDTINPEEIDFAHLARKAEQEGRIARGYVTTESGDRVPAYMLRTGKHVRAGERVLSFDIITGDQLFVDRMSYHFVKPKVGSSFVFRTRNIEGLGDSYYIKRFIGGAGDVLEIRPPCLYRNGAPITGAQAFEDNATRQGKYRGYVNGKPAGGYPRPILVPGQKYTVSKDGYIALGDNSNNSLDSRYWGEVPKKDAVGRPLWVFYPFTSHWGPAK
ncbi:signal peptidase I [Ereboglobus sp. PH5-10]|uniref:signal peptidase I n=1 Tax=Ereboglobus sp. PH5-10 TaxID=2940629 RepID=UPI002407395A|nr:signal peptidase I [Ereboglobus sp. PH5-10]MDF9826740.1 signal peptidase I [Ereboglobus sp. PH5-10]